MTDWILMKLVDIINLTTYSQLSKLHSLLKLRSLILTKVREMMHLTSTKGLESLLQVTCVFLID